MMLTDLLCQSICQIWSKVLFIHCLFGIRNPCDWWCENLIIQEVSSWSCWMLVRLWLAPWHLETVSWRRIQLSRVQRSSSPQINASDVRWVSSDQGLWRYSCIDHSVGSGFRSELSLLTWDVHYLMSTNQAYIQHNVWWLCVLYTAVIFFVS